MLMPFWWALPVSTAHFGFSQLGIFLLFLQRNSVSASIAQFPAGLCCAVYKVLFDGVQPMGAPRALPIRMIPVYVSTGLRATIQEFSAGVFHSIEDDLSASVHWCVLWEWYFHLGAFMTAKCLNTPGGKKCHWKRDCASRVFLQSTSFFSIFCSRVWYLEVLNSFPLFQM